MKANFLDLHAAADFLGPGAIEINRYQTEITDIVRRRGVFGQRMKQVPATGQPSRFFEETAIASPTATQAFVDPRNIVPTLQTPTRLERTVPLKALVSQINYNLFDMEVGTQQSQFAYLQAKDLADAVDGVLRTHDVALWNGSDTSLSTPTTPQYFGAIGQIEAGGNTHHHRSRGQHRGRTEEHHRADGLKFVVRRATDGDLCESRAARPDRLRDESGIQRCTRDGGRSRAGSP